MPASLHSVNGLEKASAETVSRVLSDVEVLAEAVGELILLVKGELVIGETALLEDLSAAGAESVGKHEGGLSLLHGVHYY